MKVGIDAFTLYPLGLDPFATLEFALAHGLDGVQFGDIGALSPGLDTGRLRELRAHADAAGLYTHVSVPTCNPYLIEGTVEDHVARLTRAVEAAAAHGWHELHSALGGGPERYEHPVPWTEHLAASTRLIDALGPALRAHGSRIDLETHGDATTFELVRLVEDVGPDIAGICLDTANVLCHAEDPVLAARRAAPYTHLTHTKDGIVFRSPGGYTRQGRPPGEGCLDWPCILPALAAHAPDLPLSIEDHKWLFSFPVDEPGWRALHPDLTIPELDAVMGLVDACERRIASGELEEPQAYEAIRFADQLVGRLHSGRDYLRRALSAAG